MTAPPPRSLGEALREALPAYEAPEALREWARAQASSEMHSLDRASKRRDIRRFAYAAGLVAALAIGWSGARIFHASGDGSRAQVLVTALVDTHVRSLMADHLTDVESSDHHTVKPWFAGKVPFAPNVPELQSQGFPLIGGRAEFVAGHTAAALVYGRGPHTINLFIWPSSASDAGAPTATYNGYALAHWSSHGLTYWAVTDAASSELEAFKRAYVASLQ
ncbi:MAG: putative transrane anti-sigma factor [Gemmatimonadetes bacterium]|nr:putative transrane anti-sigma factor [Gemmatimonadota bacterium]